MTLDAAQREDMKRAAADWAPGGEGTTTISIEVAELFPKFGRVRANPNPNPNPNPNQVAALFPKFGRFGSVEGVVHTEGVFYTPGAYVPVQVSAYVPGRHHADNVQTPCRCMCTLRAARCMLHVRGLCDAMPTHVPSRPPNSRRTRGTRCRTSRLRRALAVALPLPLRVP